jgi:hypothetical protein
MTGMSKGRGPWHDGRRAWERLNGWHQDSPSATPGHPDNGAAAVEALADIGLVRHLLDQAELVAVRTARQHGKSWAEIAVKLGITRQSAWERWRDLDETPALPRSAEGPGSIEVEDPLEAAVTDLEVAMTDAVTEVVETRARQLRRRSTVVVPNVIGLPWREALRVLAGKGLSGAAAGSDLDGEPSAAPNGTNEVILDQSPESGAKVPAGTTVTLWRERGGGSAGVREPRKPKPSPKSVREMRYEPTDDAIG